MIVSYWQYELRLVPLHQKNPWILTLQTFSALSCTSLYSAEVRSLVVSRVQGTKSDHLKHTVRLFGFPISFACQHNLRISCIRCCDCRTGSDADPHSVGEDGSLTDLEFAWKKIASIDWEDSHGMPFVIFCAYGRVWLGMVWVIGLPYRKKRLRREGQSGVALIEKTLRKPKDQSIWDKYVRSELVSTISEKERERELDREGEREQLVEILKTWKDGSCGANGSKLSIQGSIHWDAILRQPGWFQTVRLWNWVKMYAVTLY